MDTDDLSVTDAATLLGVSRTAIMSLIRRGVLPSQKFGRYHVVQRPDVLAFQARRAGKGKPGPRPRQTASEAS